MKLITLITPVGTSLFTNYLDQNSGDSGFSRNYETIKKLSASEWDSCVLEIDRLKTSCLQFIKDFKASASAELQSIAKIRDALDGDIDIEVRLLASDTIASRLAAEILAEKAYLVLKENIQIQDVEVIEGLQVEDHKVFSNTGMTKLIEKINEISWGGNWPALAINITGGFKATLPYLTILAQLKRVPLYYNFEDTDALIKIPQAPLVIDWGLIERYSDVLWQIYDGIENWQAFQNQNYQAVQDLEAFIEVDGEDALLSPIGKIFWDEYQLYFVVKLPGGSYYRYNSSDRQLIDNAIEELYERLDTVLSDTTLLDADQNNYYQKIRDLGHNDDLNHTGQIPRREIFIFKSTSNDQIRLLYTFKVGKKRIDDKDKVVSKNMITEIKIFDILCKKFNHRTYSEDWKTRFGGQNFPEINFVPRTFEIPLEILARRNQNVQTS